MDLISYCIASDFLGMQLSRKTSGFLHLFVCSRDDYRHSQISTTCTIILLRLLEPQSILIIDDARDFIFMKRVLALKFIKISPLKNYRLYGM